MDQYYAPQQRTPSGGLCYIFYVDGEQSKRIGSRTCITYQGIKYNMDVKFKSGLCKCQPSKIDDYGKCHWENAFTMLNGIPQLAAEIFDLISNNTPIPTSKPTSTPTPMTDTPTKITKNDLEDIERIASCLSVGQLDNYATWIKLAMVLKKLGAPLKLWEDLSRKSTKCRTNDCSKRWSTFKTSNMAIGTFI